MGLKRVISYDGRAELYKRGLYPRQIEVCENVMNYDKTREIAVAMSISEKTVKYHLSVIFRKLSFKRRTELIPFLIPLTVIDHGDNLIVGVIRGG